MLNHDHPVLIVEDDPGCREAVGDLLESYGYGVAYAPDGKAALSALQHGLNPSVILLDLMMPVRDGWWFRAQQLRDQALAAVPVIVMSGVGRVEKRARHLGIQDYVEKPVEPEQLIGLIGRYCDHAAARRELVPESPVSSRLSAQHTLVLSVIDDEPNSSLEDIALRLGLDIGGAGVSG
jgi:CheY-like chemotaxis protein